MLSMNLPRVLNKNNIDHAIGSYRELISSIPFSIESDNIIGFLSKLKRGKLSYGPYPNVTLFEAANRIMTDLTILYGVKDLLNNKIPQICFDNYQVEYGNENYNDHDIMATNGKVTLIGEAFNVAPSFFQGKKSSSLKKLRKNANENTLILLVYNNDAVLDTYRFKKIGNVFHLRVSQEI